MERGSAAWPALQTLTCHTEGVPEEVAFPLLNIVQRMASTQVQGPVARARKRLDGASDVIAVLADCSGSMGDLVGNSGMTKFRHLQIALADLEQGFPSIKLVAFGSIAKVIKCSAQLPDPTKGMSLGGGTNLAGALELAGQWKPRKTIVVSDGMPDSESAATAAAQAMTGAIYTIYCGPEGHPAIEFLRSLAKDTGGHAAVWDGRHEITGVIRALLPAGA